MESRIRQLALLVAIVSLVVLLLAGCFGKTKAWNGNEQQANAVHRAQNAFEKRLSKFFTLTPVTSSSIINDDGTFEIKVQLIGTPSKKQLTIAARRGWSKFKRVRTAFRSEDFGVVPETARMLGCFASSPCETN